jgi:exportin-5
LIEFGIKHRWNEYKDEDTAAMRDWILQLATNLQPTDPAFVRNKTAQLWVDMAKRCWGKMLVKLWNIGSVVHKEFVLYVLETLADEIFNKEDPSTALREADLSRCCIEIFSHSHVLQAAFPGRQVPEDLRYGDEGWLIRLGVFFEECMAHEAENEQYRSCAIKALTTIKSAMSWALLKAAAAADCVGRIFRGLVSSHVPIQVAAIEALYALYARGHYMEDDFSALVCPIYTTDRVNLLRKIYEWSIVDPTDIDEDKYLLSKKLSEVCRVRMNHEIHC